MLNDDMFEDITDNFFKHLYSRFAENAVYPTNKENYILTSLSSVYTA